MDIAASYRSLVIRSANLVTQLVTSAIRHQSSQTHHQNLITAHLNIATVKVGKIAYSLKNQEVIAMLVITYGAMKG